MPVAIPEAEHVLALRGRGGYRQYRIPALAVTTHGTVLAAYDGRPNLDDLPSPIDLLIRRSTDSGQTWGGQEVVRSGTGLEGLGDPSLLVDAETGRIFLFHAAGTRAGFFESATGMAPDDPAIQHTDLSWSDDDGVTWQHRRLTAELKGSSPAGRDVTGIFAAAGQGIQIHAGPFTGRLVQQFVLLCGGEIMAASAYSDNYGERWTLGEFISAGTHGAAPNENKVTALDDGRLLLHSRATPRRLAATSTDGGHSWSPLAPVEDLPDPSDNGSLTRFDGLPSVMDYAGTATDQWLLATNNRDTALRRNTVLGLSPDNGSTWPAGLVLCAGSSAYSTATRLPDGNIGVLYERQGYREIVFASIPAAQLTDQLETHPQPAAQEPAAGLSFDMELRSITPGLPEVWRNAGEFHVMADGGGDWGPASKEIGQGYSAGQAQVLGTREAQDLNYGPVIPGYKAGDILAFTGRARNDGGATVTGVTLTGPGAAAFPPRDLLPGEAALYFTPSYTLTAADVEQDAVDITFAVEGTSGGTVRRLSRIFRFSMASGEVSVEDAPPVSSPR
ncbi:Exo-alpha-sialidase [Pseudarthrobacter chlorophenolicus A6]|uniref:exo-alpha-sialidase n=1 Tax=Pseudarthrobacter chlorophenolicus (strain ATCC 700700 / DSM 12829 / CIP 107037 / JCM 12360 / KCTC 9906 / NCIMB 13794 / A6) TaxID=452863 RepID=B8HGS6_PSECP|nr:sialidase family protein [Pseudarthrobacter chlorophenolicus]ACL41342.1 Exo-alpha-sialidase [Pseudarthrobacter chlorophenolicus A6]